MGVPQRPASTWFALLRVHIPHCCVRTPLLKSLFNIWLPLSLQSYAITGGCFSGTSQPNRKAGTASASA